MMGTSAAASACACVQLKKGGAKKYSHVLLQAIFLTPPFFNWTTAQSDAVADVPIIDFA